jgi:hypothetical protein
MRAQEVTLVLYDLQLDAEHNSITKLNTVAMTLGILLCVGLLISRIWCLLYGCSGSGEGDSVWF